MARRTKIHVGLEIGTSKTCMVVGEVKADSAVKILGIGVTKTAGVRKGEIYDFAQARACLKDALAKAEDARAGITVLGAQGYRAQLQKTETEAGQYQRRFAIFIETGREAKR